MERGEREFMKQQGVEKWGNRKKERKRRIDRKRKETTEAA